MKKRSGIFFLVLIIVIFLGIFSAYIYTKLTAEFKEIKNSSDNINNYNSIIENKENNNEIEAENEVQTVVTENEIKNSLVVNSIPETSSNIYEKDNDTGSTDKKQEAISLVKKKWGEDSTVSFRCESVLSSGDYVVAVVSKKTGKVQNYFKVNLIDKTVEVDY